MGSQFKPTTALPDQGQQRYVPRAPDANGGGPQGHALVGLVFGEEVLFDALAITDTAAHDSNGPASGNPTGTAFDQAYGVYKTALVTSTLNEAVSIQPQWSRDLTNWYAFGTATAVTAWVSGAAVGAAIALSGPSLYVPYVRLVATCATAPTSGVLNAWLERLG